MLGLERFDLGMCFAFSSPPLRPHIVQIPSEKFDLLRVIFCQVRGHPVRGDACENPLQLVVEETRIPRVRREHILGIRQRKRNFGQEFDYFGPLSDRLAIITETANASTTHVLGTSKNIPATQICRKRDPNFSNPLTGFLPSASCSSARLSAI